MAVVVGSTPYMEKNDEYAKENIEWMIGLAWKHNLHLDFHIDYNLDPGKEPMVPRACKLLREYGWPFEKTVVFGHCTRLTLLSDSEWKNLSLNARNLPVSFVGLPTSDLFMMRRPLNENSDENQPGQRVRGTLQVPHMIQEHGFDAAIAINNVGNAFTPHGSCDPLSLASFCVGIYQAGTKLDADLLYVRPNIQKLGF